MFKRSIARLLVFFQLYGVVFQGVAHANILQHYPVQNEIYLHSSFDEDGGLRLSLGTDSPAKGLETLGVIDVPSYKTLKSQNQKLKFQVDPSDSSSSASEDLLSPASSSFVSTDDDTDVEEDADTGDDSNAFTTQDGIVRLPEGVYFDLQGLQIFMNNEGELLIQGAQTDFTKPIFLSSKKSIVLHSVEANVLKLTSPSVVGVGKSSIDFLALEGLMSDEGEEVAATYINTGSLTAKEVFLKNLTSSNMGTLTTDGFEAQGGTFRNTGTLAMSADAQSGNRAFTDTTVINDGTIEGLHYNIAGSSFTQNGRLKGRVLKVGQNTTFATGAHQELTLSERLDSASLARWKLTGTVNVHEFNHLGSIDLEGTLNTTTFTGHGTVQPAGTLTSERSHFIDAFTNLGQVSAHILDADAALTTNGLMRVSNAAEIRGKFKVGAKGRFIGIEDQSLSLTCHDTANIAGRVDVDSLSAAKSISVKGRGQLVARQSSTLTDQLTIQPKSVVQFKGLKANGASIENHGTLTVVGIETGTAGLSLTNTGTAHIDAEQVLPRASEGGPENSAWIATNIILEETQAARRALAMVDPLSRPEVFTNSNLRTNEVNSSGLFLNYIAKMKTFLQSTAEGQRYIQEVLGGDINRLPKNKIHFLAENPIQKYEAWWNRTFIESIELTEAVARRVLLGIPEKKPSPLSSPEVFAADYWPSGNGITVRSYKDYILKLKMFLQSTEEGRQFVEEVFEGNIEKRYCNRDSILTSDPIEKYKYWLHANYEVPTQIALRISEKIERIRKAEAELALIPSPESHPDKCPVDDSRTLGGSDTLYKRGKFLDFFNTTAEGRRFLAEEFALGIPATRLAFNDNNPIKKYRAWYRENYEIPAGISSSVAEILEQKGELQRKAIEAREREAELSLIPSPEAHPDNSPVDDSFVPSGSVVLDKRSKFLTFLNKTAEGRRFLAEEYPSGFAPNKPDFNSNNNPIKKYREWYRINYVVPVEVASSVAAALEKKIAQTQQAIEESEIARLAAPVKKRPIKLNLTNQATGQVTLKSGRFDFVEDTAFANDGTLVQDHACLHWITGLPGAFNTGTWAVKGSLGLVGYKAEDVGTLEVEETLHVHTTEDALKALGSMSKVKAAKIVMFAPQLRHTTATEMVLPWVLELHLDEDFSSVGNIATCGLQLFCKGFDGNADLAAGIQDGVEITSEEQGFLKVTATENVKLGVNGYFYGKKGVGVKAKNLAVEGRQAVPNPVLRAYPGQYGALGTLSLGDFHYKRSSSGLYSTEGPIVLDVAEEIRNSFGTMDGAYFVIKGKLFHNIAGLLQGKDATQQSQIIAETVRNVREAPGSYSQTVPWNHGTYAGGRKCNTHGTGCNGWHTTDITVNYETSFQSVIEHAGDLEIIYRTLVNEVSDISSAKSVFLDARSADQTLEVGDAGTRIQLEENQLPRTATPHQGVTAVWDRNDHTSLIRGKQGISGTLGSAHLEGGMRGNSIALRAAEMTFQNMQLNKKQAASLLNLAQSIQNGGSSIYKRLGNTEVFDTRFPLASGQYPHSIVAMGAMPQKIDLWATWGAFEHAFGQNFPYLYRGLDYLGISFAQLCEVTAEEVRSRAGSEVRRHLIEDSKGCYEIDVVTHPELMTASDLKKSPLPMLVIEFGRNASRAEDDMLRAQQAKVAEAKGKSLGERAQELLKAAHTQPKAQFDISLVVPEQESVRGVKANEDASVVTQGPLEMFTNISGRNVAMVSEESSVTLGSNVRRHYHAGGYTDELDRSKASALATLLIRGKTGVNFKAAETHSGVRTDIIAETGAVVDESVVTTTYREQDQSTKKKQVVIKTTDHHHNVSSHGSDGVVNIWGDDIYQYGTKLRNTAMGTNKGGHIAQYDVADERSVDVLITSKNKGFFGNTTSKSSHSISRSTFSKGCQADGRAFSVLTDEYYAVNPRIVATRSDITAAKATIVAGVNQSQSVEQSSSQGTIWNKSKVSKESRTTYVNPTFEGDVNFHSPSVSMQRRAGSGTANITSDSAIAYVDMLDQSDSSSKSQKSLSAGAALIVRLAVTLPMLLNPATFGLSGTYGVMANAGYGTLCSELWVNMIEQDGNVGRALKAMEKKDIVLSVARSMATAGLTKELGDAIGVKTGFELGQDGKVIERTFGDYAKAATLQSAVNTAMSVAIDGVNPGEALKRGAISAGLNTLASWGAGQIGYLYREEAVNYGVHKVLHGMTGAGLGAGLAVISHQDPRLGAVSGAFGAVLSEVVAEGFAPKTEDVKQYQKDRPDQKPEDVRSHFMEKAQSTANWAAFASAVGAFGLGMDVTSAHAAARNAVDNNFVHMLFWAFTIATLVEYPQYIRDLKAEEAHVALGKMGIRVAEGTAIGVAGGAVLGKAFEVGGKIVYSLKEALLLARTSTPVMTTEVAQLFTQFEKHAPQIEKMMVEEKIAFKAVNPEEIPFNKSLVPVANIQTPYEIALQSNAAEALYVQQQVKSGATLYRTGTMGTSHVQEAQFWALEHSLAEGFAQRYGIPSQNVIKSDFIVAGTIKPGAEFITRAAPRVGSNLGGGIEVVVKPGDVALKSFSMIE